MDFASIDDLPWLLNSYSHIFQINPDHQDVGFVNKKGLHLLLPLFYDGMTLAGMVAYTNDLVKSFGEKICQDFNPLTNPFIPRFDFSLDQTNYSLMYESSRIKDAYSHLFLAPKFFAYGFYSALKKELSNDEIVDFVLGSTPVARKYVQKKDK